MYEEWGMLHFFLQEIRKRITKSIFSVEIGKYILIYIKITRVSFDSLIKSTMYLLIFRQNLMIFEGSPNSRQVLFYRRIKAGGVLIQRLIRIGWVLNLESLNPPLHRKYSFWANLVHKIKIVSLRWNLRLRLIGISKTQWQCSLFSFSTGNALFGQIWSKLPILSVYGET